MAKKKKKSTKNPRRRVSGIGNLQPILLAAAGGVAGQLLTNFAENQFGLSKTISGALGIAAGGLVLPMILKGPTGAALGAGMAAAGGVKVASSFGIAGVRDFYNVPTINGMKRIAGAKQVLAGSAKQVLAGVDLVKKSASTRQYQSGNYNFATGGNQMSVISGFPELYEACFEK